MCHLQSLGRVANFKNEACANGGIGFVFFEFLTCCTCCRMIIRGGGGGGWGMGGGGWGGVLTFLTSTSFTLRKMHALHMLSYDHQGGFPALAFSLQMEPEVLQPVVTKITPTKGSRCRKSTTKKISLLRLIIFQVVCGVNPKEPLLLVLNKWMEHGNT